MFLPEYNISNPFLIPSSSISLTSKRISTANIIPKPLTSRIILCLSPRARRPFLKYLPVLAAFSTSLSSTSASRVAIPAAHARGLPAKVEECSPTFIASMISGFTNVNPIGTPPAIPFARHMISGVVSQFCPAHILPVLPRPV